MGYNFLKKFCVLLEDTEVPYTFAVWCGISSLLAMLERRIWIDQGVYTIYPNFFFVLIAGSGQTKSTAINLTDKLLRKVDPGPRIIAQMITPEGLINALTMTRSDRPLEMPQVTCGGVSIGDELVTLIDKRTIEKGLGKVLTTLYDCKDVFEYQTVSRGKEILHGSYLSLLGGTTVELLKESIPLQSVGGGLTSRIVFIYDDSIPDPVPWVEYNEKHTQIMEELIHYLQRLTSLSGPITVTPEARSFYEEDYREIYRSAFRLNPYLRGYANRRHAHLFKIAIAVMVAEKPDLTMTEHHLRGAKYILEAAEEHMENVMEMIVSTEMGTSTNHILSYINAHKSITRSDLLRKFAHRFDAQELSKIIETLVVSKRITIDAEGGGIVYRAKGSEG